MAKVISQDTFDDVVKENIVEFSMDSTEAKMETIKQFEAQGIQLSNIIKDLAINSETGQPILNEAIETLTAYISDKSTERHRLLEHLLVLESECQKSIPHRVLAGKIGAHDALISLLEQNIGDDKEQCDLQVLEKCLQAVNSLTFKQPDIFDAEALAIAMKLLDNADEGIICLTLQWLQKSCVMHELNRQNMMNANIMGKLKPLIKNSNIQVTRELLALLRFLVLDDDIRVEFGCAHEHARQIASEVIVDLTKLLTEYTDEALLSDLILTIGSLAVRQEFCTTIEDAGGLKFVLNIMAQNPNSERLNCEALKLLRALAGNDAVKMHIIQQGAAPIIKDLLETHMANTAVVTAALACISTLTLRVKDNSSTFFNTGIAETIVETIRMHPQNKIVQRNGAWAIRNMVSRSRDQCETWLSYGTEDLLNCAISQHPSVLQDIKAALRDLGCKVDLKEEWTGKAEKKILNKQ